MQCQCGADAVTQTAVRKALKAELSFYQCKMCKRVSDGVLFIEGIEVAYDQGGTPLARSSFNTLTEESARELLDAAAPPKASLNDQAEFAF